MTHRPGSCDDVHMTNTTKARPTTTFSVCLPPRPAFTNDPEVAGPLAFESITLTDDAEAMLTALSAIGAGSFKAVRQSARIPRIVRADYAGFDLAAMRLVTVGNGYRITLRGRIASAAVAARRQREAVRAVAAAQRAAEAQARRDAAAARLADLERHGVRRVA